VNPLRRKSAPEIPTAADEATFVPAGGGKGRPTPKRRTKSAPPAPAPRTRKEASAWQKQQRKNSDNPRKSMSNEEYRTALKAGDPRVLPKRDQGAVRGLARDWVDSHRMVSNYLLLLFVLFLAGRALPILEYVAILLFLVIFAEWFFVGNKVKKIALERGVEVAEGAITLGFYAGSRAYMPRSWRRPGVRLNIGDKI
jgi:hypothetical protein